MLELAGFILILNESSIVIEIYNITSTRCKNLS